MVTSPDPRSAIRALTARRVVKIGGRAFASPANLAGFARDLASQTHGLVLVHGGGSEVSDWCERLGIPARFEDGLRVTDPAALDVAVAVLSGLANKRLVAALRGAGVDAVGLSALDGGTVEITPHTDAAKLGRVGSIRSVDAGFLESLLARGSVPVLASIGALEGELWNLNADDVAAAIAGALRVEELVLLSDVPGVIAHGTVLPRLMQSEIEAWLARADVSGGMRPKLRAAQTALDAGVGKVRITQWLPGTTGGLDTGTEFLGTGNETEILGSEGVEAFHA